MKPGGDKLAIISIAICGIVMILSTGIGIGYYHRGCDHDNCTYIRDGLLWKIVVNNTVLCNAEFKVVPRNFTICYDDGIELPYCPRYSRCRNKGTKIGVIVIDIVCGTALAGMALIYIRDRIKKSQNYIPLP